MDHLVRHPVMKESEQVSKREPPTELLSQSACWLSPWAPDVPDKDTNLRIASRLAESSKGRTQNGVLFPTCGTQKWRQG